MGSPQPIPNGKTPLPFVIPSLPGIPTSPFSSPTTYVVLLKENHMQFTEAATATGNPGEPRDLQFRGPLLGMFFDICGFLSVFTQTL
jgi:hypothetical protein